MKKKIAGIFVFMLMIVTAVSATVNSEDNIINNQIIYEKDTYKNRESGVADEADFRFKLMEEMPIPRDLDGNSTKPTIIETPDYFNWMDYEGQDWMTPAKNQGDCGSCWDFAAIGTLESIIKIREKNSMLSPDLSEQYVLSCLPAAANYYGEGCMGGTPYKAFYYMMITTSYGNYKNGAIPESCFPYQANDDIPCSDKCENWEDLLVPILDCNESYLGFDNPENRAIIKSLVYQYGPIAAAMNVTQSFIDFWNTHHNSTDYFPDPNLPWGNRLNHIIVILGWKNDSSINNGGYWICKNSWGTIWGYQGFFNIEYGALFTGYYISTVDYDPVSYNWPPTVPVIEGITEGIPGIEYNYKFISEDQDGDNEVYYYIDWGDDTNSNWLGPFISGNEVTINHTWSKRGTYILKAKAKDSNSSESDWGTLTVTIPRTRAKTYLRYEWLLARFPILEKLLNLLR